jgi:hypothetical protein
LRPAPFRARGLPVGRRWRALIAEHRKKPDFAARQIEWILSTFDQGSAALFCLGFRRFIGCYLAGLPGAQRRRSSIDIANREVYVAAQLARTRREMALKPLYIMVGSAGLVILWIELFRRVCL